MIPVLVAYLALLLLVAGAALVARPRWIDKLALAGLLALAVLTKPDQGRHLAAIEAAAGGTSIDPVLTHGDYLLVSATTGDKTIAIGAFDQVFVFRRAGR